MSPDGKFAVFLVDGAKPRLDGIPAHMLLGELHVAPLDGGSPRKVANGVTNVPGGYLFSPDSRWLLYLAGYNAATQTGELSVLNLTDPASDAKKLASGVGYMMASPDSKRLAFVEGSELKVIAIDGSGDLMRVASEVTTSQFSPDSAQLFFKRNVAAAGGLYRVNAVAPEPPKKLADQVGEYRVSPDGKRVAFAQRSQSVPGTYDLFLASAPDFKPAKLAAGSAGFHFSPDSQWLARTENVKPEMLPEILGDLYVGPAQGGAGRKVAERVREFSFSPDSQALAFLERWDPKAPNPGQGTVGVVTLPDGAPKRLGIRSPNYAWGADGKSLAFLSRFLQPIYSVDLMLYQVGEEEAFKVHQGVFGYGFGPKNEYLLFRSSCIREGRACDLYKLDLGKPKEPAKVIVQGVYSFKPSKDGERLLISYARMEKDMWDVAVFNVKTNQHKTLDQFTALPALFLDDAGSRVTYLVAAPARRGLYVATDVP